VRVITTAFRVRGLLAAAASGREVLDHVAVVDQSLGQRFTTGFGVASISTTTSRNRVDVVCPYER
jgi:hypothetical protein